MVYSVQETEVNQKLIPKIWGIEAFDFHETCYRYFMILKVDLEIRKRELESVFKDMESEEEVKKGLPPIVLFYLKQLFFSVDSKDPHS